MASTGQGTVPFTKDTVMKCKCGSCPIHKQSDCVAKVVAKLTEHMELLDQNPLSRDGIPGAYCAGGLGACDDLNFRNACVCGTCDIFNDDYNLAGGRPGGYYCKGGRA